MTDNNFTFLDSVDSTNKEIQRRFIGEDSLAHGHVIVAKSQSGGQGRQGREWSSPEGNLYYSELHIIDSYKDVNAYAFIVALAVFDTVTFFIHQATEDILPLMIKWPNDILWDGAKLAGILLETEKHPETKDIGLVIGGGINNLDAPDLQDREAVCLRELMKDKDAPSQQRLAKRLHAYIGTWSEIYQKDGLATILQAWRQRSHNIGDPIMAKQGNDKEPINGRFSGLTPSGAIKIETETGEETIYAGDIYLTAQKQKKKAS